MSSVSSNYQLDLALLDFDKSSAFVRQSPASASNLVDDAVLAGDLMLDRQDAASRQVAACLVALGSNHHANQYLATARAGLQNLATHYRWSTPLVNPDHTATPEQPKPDYTNQCGILIFDVAVLMSDLVAHTKHIEQLCHRGANGEYHLPVEPVRSNNKRHDELTADTLPTGDDKKTQSGLADSHAKIISMDIDILAVRLTSDKDDLCQAKFKRSTLRDSNEDGERWRVIQQRYPFKRHEQMGMRELIMFASQAD